MIPAAAVAAAARAYVDYAATRGHSGHEAIRRALEAAVPHMHRPAKADAWDEAMKVADALAWEHDASAASAVRMAPNPYRTPTDAD